MKHTVKHVTLNNPHDYQCKRYNWWCMQGCDAYVQGVCKPNYPLPAIRYTNELINFNGRISFCLMYRLPNNFMRPVGDSPQYQLIF